MTALVRFEIEARQFALDGEWPPRFAAWPEGYEPLCRVVETAWMYDPVKFLSSIMARTGQSFEGVVSFGFHEQYPEEIPEGVSLDYLGDELLLSERFLDAFVARFVRETITLAARARVELPEQVAGLAARLERSA
jgi:hypothetical protein